MCGFEKARKEKLKNCRNVFANRDNVIKFPGIMDKMIKCWSKFQTFPIINQTNTIKEKI